MKNLTIAIPDDRLRTLQQVAIRLGITTEDLVRIGIEQLLDRPEESFDRALRYVFEKNVEFYRRMM